MGVSDAQLERAELGMFREVGLDPARDLQIRNVPIWQNKNEPRAVLDQYYLHEIHVKPKTEGLPKLVMIHGYGGGGAVFYKMMKHLREYFDVYTIDFLGQGMSGRPPYEHKEDFDQTVEYFIESIRAWMELTGFSGPDGHKYTLFGHSLGGMFTGYYALKYPENIEKIYFASSVGIMATMDFAKLENFLPSMDSSMARYGANWMQRQLMGDSYFSPFDLYRALGARFGKQGIRNGMKRRMETGDFMTQYEVEYLSEYVYQMMIR